MYCYFCYETTLVYFTLNFRVIFEFYFFYAGNFENKPSNASAHLKTKENKI